MTGHNTDTPTKPAWTCCYASFSVGGHLPENPDPTDTGWTTAFPPEVAVLQGRFSGDLVAHWSRWVARRVTSYDAGHDEGVRITHSVDFRIPSGRQSLLDLQSALNDSGIFARDQVFVPLMLLPNRLDGMSFDVIGPEGQRLPLLDSAGNLRFANRVLADALGAAWGIHGPTLLPEQPGMTSTPATAFATEIILRCRTLASTPGAPISLEGRPDPVGVSRWGAIRNFGAAADPSFTEARRIDFLAFALGLRSIGEHRERLEALVRDARALMMLKTYSLGIPAHVALDPTPGTRQVVRIRWVATTQEPNHEPWWTVRGNPYLLDVLPVAHSGGCASQHVQLIVEPEVEITGTSVFFDTPDRLPRDRSGFRVDEKPARHRTHFTVKAPQDEMGEVTVEFPPTATWLAYTYTTSRRTIARGMGAIAVACVVLTAAAFIAALLIEVSEAHPKRPTQSLVGIMTFVAGLLGVVAPQLGLGPQGRLSLKVPVRNLAVSASAALTAGATLAVMDALQYVSADETRWVCIGLLGTCALTCATAAVAPIDAALRLTRRRARRG